MRKELPSYFLMGFPVSLLLLSLLLGCGADTFFEKASSSKMEYQEEARADFAPSEKEAAGEAPPAKAPEPQPASTLAPAAPPEQPVERKRVYSGFCNLLVDNVEEQKRQIAGLAEESGGYVESVYEQTVIMRIPAEQFHTVFQQILDLGEVHNKSIETIDVTEYFRDQKSRLDIAQKTRERLYILLERTSDVQERLKILREIKRLTEEIERIKLTLELLERQIAFSRITVQLTSRLPREQLSRETIPFAWIAELDPLYPSLNRLKGRIKLELSGNFAVFEREKIFRAESAEGIRVRVGSTANEPEGDTVFWQKALLHHLSRYYRKTEELDFGRIKGVLFTSKDRRAFYYLVGVVVRADLIYVIEVFFPDSSSREAELEGIVEALKAVEVS